MNSGTKLTQWRNLAKIMSVNSDGSLTLKYCKGNTFETIHHDNIRWIEARGNDKWFRKPGDINFFSKPHKVKGFADNISIISKSPRITQMLFTKFAALAVTSTV